MPANKTVRTMLPIISPKPTAPIVENRYKGWRAIEYGPSWNTKSLLRPPIYMIAQNRPKTAVITRNNPIMSTTSGTQPELSQTDCENNNAGMASAKDNLRRFIRCLPTNFPIELCSTVILRFRFLREYTVTFNQAMKLNKNPILFIRNLPYAYFSTTH